MKAALVQQKNDLNNYRSQFTFYIFYDISGLFNQTTDSMLMYCKDLEVVLMFNNSSDIDTLELYEELKLLSKVVGL